LARGYALVRDVKGVPLRKAVEITSGQALLIEFADGWVGAAANGGGGAKPVRKRAPKARDNAEPSLFE
jgi:exodeoxyribonuclease VII large subunit